jgi:hypothetical protein
MKGGTKLPKSRRRFDYNRDLTAAKPGTKNALDTPRAKSWSPETGFANAPSPNWNRFPRIQGH